MLVFCGLNLPERSRARARCAHMHSVDSIRIPEVGRGYPPDPVSIAIAISCSSISSFGYACSNFSGATKHFGPFYPADGRDEQAIVFNAVFFLIRDSSHAPEACESRPDGSGCISEPIHAREYLVVHFFRGQVGHRYPLFSFAFVLSYAPLCLSLKNKTKIISYR